ncbi:MAG: hypothetical protein ABIV47_20660 [Roseiflexaceae bacterium]
MKKTSTSSDTPQDNDMQAEYHFDYTKARPNRFAPTIAEGSRVVVLDPDIAKVFRSPDAVNVVLRALIATMPKTKINDKAA